MSIHRLFWGDSMREQLEKRLAQLREHQKTLQATILDIEKALRINQEHALRVEGAIIELDAILKQAIAEESDNGRSESDTGRTA